MLGTTFRKFALAAVTLAFLAGANVAYAKGAQNLAPPGPQQTIQQVVAGPTAINDFQKLNRTVQDLQSTFDDDTQGNRIFGALANPVVPRFTAEANALHDLLKDPGFIKSLPEGQRADIVHTLNQLEQSTRTIVKTWGAASTIHSQSLQNLNQSLGDIHRLLESLNQQTQSNAGAVFTAGVPPSVPATAGAPPPPPLLPTVGVPSPAPSAVGVAPQVPAAGINQNLNPHSSPPSSVSQPAVVSSQTAPVQGYAFTNEMNRESQVQASNTAEENNLNSQIAQSKLKAAQAEEAARVKQAEERQLVATYHLSVPQLPPVPLPYQTPGIAPPINGFSPDNVGVAWIDYQINQINHEARMPAKGNLANGTPFTLEMNNAPQVSEVVPLGKGNYFSIVPDLPFREELNLTQISQGLTQIGTQSTLSQVAGPLYGAQILADLRNYVVMHPTRGQDVLYDARMGPLGGIVQSLTVHVTPVISFDQQGHRVEEKLYNVGIVQTVGAVLGKLDYILGNRGIIGHSSDHFVFENLGYQLKVNDYHRAFTYDASFNRDPNATYIDVYKIDDPHTRYRQNNHHGWEKVDSSVPFDSRLDMYRATVRGFILHVDPSKGTIQGQGDVYTAETFVTDDFARRLTEQETGKAVTGKPYLEPNAVFMERMPSLQDLQLEKQLLKGFDAQGHMIWGVLRNPLSGHIVRFITDPRQLNETSALTDNHGQRLRFVPGKAFQAPSGLQEAGGIIRDYTSDEFSRVFDEWRQVLHTPTVAEKYGHYDLSKRPQLTQIPPELRSLFSGGGLILESSPALKSIYQAAQDHYGVIYFTDGRPPAVLDSLDHVRTIGFLDARNGVTRLPDGLYMFTGLNKQLDPKTQVLLDDQQQVIGVVDPSNKMRQERIQQLQEENRLIDLRLHGFAQYGVAIDAQGHQRALDQPAEDFYPAKDFGDEVVGRVFGIKLPGEQAPSVITGNTMVRVKTVTGADGKEHKVVVEILEAGKRTIDDYQVITSALRNGGIQAEDRRSIDPVTGSPRFDIFIKGNVLTPQEQQYNSTHLQKIRTESELAELVIKSQAVMVPVEGTDKQRFVILPKAPEPQLELPAPGAPSAPSAAPVRHRNTQTLLAPDGNIFQGTTIDAEMFRSGDIAKLNILGATAVRTYLPIPVDLARQIVERSSVRTIIVGIPFNAHAYDHQNLSSFWGQTPPTPVEGVSLESHNYLPYLRQLSDALGGRAKIVVDLGNELNLHPDWIGGVSLENLFKEINRDALGIKEALGENVAISFTLGDNPRDFQTALTNAPAVEFWGINCYRNIASLQEDWLRATREAGVSRPFYIAETGKNSNAGEGSQANADLTDWRTAHRLGISALLMTLQDNPAKIARDPQETYGLYDEGGMPKFVVDKVAQAWAPETPTTVAKSGETLAWVNEHYALVRLKSAHPAATYAQEVLKPLQTERVRISDIDQLTPQLEQKAVEILKIDAQGRTIGRFVKMFDGGYQLMDVHSMGEYLRTHFLVVSHDMRYSGYVSWQDLKDPRIHEIIREHASEVTMMDIQQHVTARVYLNRDMNGSRVEVMQPHNTSLIFELPSYFPGNLSDPVAKTMSVLPKDSPDGLLHVWTTDLRQVNQGVVVEDVYRTVANGKPVQIYSNRFLQNDRIYFKDGHEYYSTAIDGKGGQTVVIDGKTVDHVTGIFSYDPRSNNGYHVGLRDLQGNGEFAPLRFTTFKDGQISVDQTGFVGLTGPLSYEGIMNEVHSSGVLNMTDRYSYKADGQFDTRVISFLDNGRWQSGWTLQGSTIAPAPQQLFDLLTANQVIAQAFANYHLDRNTVLIKTIKIDTNNVISEDYRISGDVRERKFISVIKQDGAVVKIVVGLDFDRSTGEQLFSYTLTPDGQVESLSRTLPNKLTFQELLPPGAGEEYTRFMAKQFGIQGADYRKDMADNGISPNFVPVLVEEVPFLVATDKPGEHSYKSIEPQIRPLVEAYTKANEHDRPALLRQITDTVRRYNRQVNTAHYTSQPGQPTYHFLAPPNDSRGRDFITKTSKGETILNMWQLEGRGSFSSNILPASMVFDPQGSLKRTMVLDHYETRSFPDAQGNLHELRVNVYKVLGDEGLKEMVFTSLGTPVSETTLYGRNRVVNGILGVETRGQETIYFDPLFDYSLPLYGTLDEDGRLTKTELNLTYSAQNGNQVITETSIIQEPTSPGDYKIKTQTITNGKPIQGTLYEEEALKTLWRGVRDNWLLYFLYPSLFVAAFSGGGIIRKFKSNKIKKSLAEQAVKNELEGTLPPAQAGPIVDPSWNSYGFGNGAVAVAQRRFESTIVDQLKKEPLQDVLDEYFHGYQTWRKEVMGIDGPFNPTIEDLWVMFLRDADNDIFNANVPDGLNYLMYKALEAKEQYGKDADIGGFIRKEYIRWHNIIELQQTTFQGLSGGKIRNVVPYDYYFTVEDLNDMFRTKANIEWYDNLGYTLDGKMDMRSAIYDDFIATLKKKVNFVKSGDPVVFSENEFKGSMTPEALIKAIKESNVNIPVEETPIQTLNKLLERNDLYKFMNRIPGETKAAINQLKNGQQLKPDDLKKLNRLLIETNYPLEAPKRQLGIEDLADKVEGNVFRMKRLVASLFAYKEYVRFFKQVQEGKHAVSKNFNFQGLSGQEADLLINGKPLMRKTFSESGSWVGKMPLPLRLIKPLAQFVRNSYKQLTNPIILTSTVGLSVAAYDHMLSWGGAAIYAGLTFLAIKGLYYPLSYLLDIKLNTKSFGKPAAFWKGYPKAKVTRAQKGYRAAFWTSVVSAKVAWDAFLIHYFLIPYSQMAGGAYYPVVLGHEIPVNMNLLLMGMNWATAALFLYVGNFAAIYLIKPFFTFIHGSLRGLGTIKTPEDIRALYKEDLLDRLIEQKLLPHGGAGLTPEQRENARKAIIKLAFDQHRYVRDEVSDEEYDTAIKEGRLDHIKNPEVQKSVTQSVNALLMDMPRMPSPDENTPISVVTPLYGEDIIYAYDKSDMPTTLDMMLNTGYTNLNYLIWKAPQRWENLIERVKKQNIGTPNEWARMEALLPQKEKMTVGLLGPISDDLKMQIRLWASYEGQPFARTLDGLMNIVRWHQLYLKLSFPKWTQEQIRERTNQDVQILWAYQIWGDVLKAGPDKPDLQLKREDTLYLLKKYYDELGYFIDIASLQTRKDDKGKDISVKVLSRYNPNTGNIEDVADIPNTANRPITLEGKPSNQMHALTFARNKFRFTIDMNQDLDPLEAMKIPILIQEFKDKNVALVNTPELIFTGGFSSAGMFHVVSDRTFVTSDKRHMGMVSSPSHHGHPDVWRDSDIVEHGGVSSTVAVSEDYKGGIQLMLRGRTILNKEYMQWKKARELSWTGTDGIWRKFSMGAAQLLLGRYAHWMNKYFGPVSGAGEFYSGPHFYTLNTIAAMGFFLYAVNVMLGGISPFTAFPAPAVVMTLSVLYVGQALTFIGITQMALENGVRKALKQFLKLIFFMAPFYIAHIFTYQAGMLSGLAGLAGYVATGRGFNRENVNVDKLLKVFTKSHVGLGVIGLALSGLAYGIWRNETFLLSISTILSFLCPLLMPFVMNPGNYPMHGVSMRKSAQLFKENNSKSLKYLKDSIKDAWARKSVRKFFADTVGEAVAYGVWFAVTAPVALPGLVANMIRGNPEIPGPIEPAPKPAPKPSPSADKAMQTLVPKAATPGGIDLTATRVDVSAPHGRIRLSFDDPALLSLLLKADGLAPIIYDVKTMTPSMADHFVGLDY
ncbi:MAG: hypothetical protein KGJ95_08280 [Candidatus Omnitrophica bacterium]|nr:hypothetical protein [Candidatus Omnitrophota bacterium]